MKHASAMVILKLELNAALARVEKNPRVQADREVMQIVQSLKSRIGKISVEEMARDPGSIFRAMASAADESRRQENGDPREQIVRRCAERYAGDRTRWKSFAAFLREVEAAIAGAGCEPYGKDYLPKKLRGLIRVIQSSHG